MQMKIKFDNPWLVYAMFIIFPIYGFLFGWIFGPIFVHVPNMLPDTDAYSYSLMPNLEVAIFGVVFGLVAAGLITYKLAKTADLKIPDEQLGHSDDPELDAEWGWHAFYQGGEHDLAGDHSSDAPHSEATH